MPLSTDDGWDKALSGKADEPLSENSYVWVCIVAGFFAAIGIAAVTAGVIRWLF